MDNGKGPLACDAPRELFGIDGYKLTAGPGPSEYALKTPFGVYPVDPELAKTAKNEWPRLREDQRLPFMEYFEKNLIDNVNISRKN